MQNLQQMGECPQCKTSNPYTQPFCGFCGARLPWADALVAQKNQAANDANEQARLAARVNLGMDKAGLTRDSIAEATKTYVNSPEFKASAAKEAQSWAKFGAFFLGCFGVCVVLLLLFFIVAMMAS